MRLKLSSAKWRPCCLGLNVLIIAVYLKFIFLYFIVSYSQRWEMDIPTDIHIGVSWTLEPHPKEFQLHFENKSMSH